MPISDALNALSSLLGDRLSRSKPDLEHHGHSEAHFPLTPPDAVAYPKNTDEVQALVRICADHACPMVGWGAGTSLEGHALAVQGGVVVDFSRMKRLIDLRQADMDCTVQPGITREALNLELRSTGLFFSVDPGANASIGGMASTRASGTTALRYGTMKENVLGLQVVLADGRVIRTGTRARKSASGYDLTSLWVGAEGTLGLITELTLRLHGQPEIIAAGICAFDRIGDAVDAVVDTIQVGLPMARLEFVDSATVACFNAYARAEMEERPHLLFEMHGSADVIAEQTGTFRDIVSDHGGGAFQWSDHAEERNALWAMRHNAAYAIFASRPGSRNLVTDICVPISRLAEAVEAARTDLDQASIPGPMLGHVGDGNFHVTLMADPARPEEMKEAQALSHRMVERALELGGTATGEHGIGMGKLGYMEREHGEAWDVMGQLKRSLDPKNVMNPGKVTRQN